MTNSLPPLPDNLRAELPDELAVAKVLAYGQQCRQQALDEAAKVCAGIDKGAWPGWKRNVDPIDQGRSIGAEQCASAIRAMKEKT